MLLNCSFEGWGELGGRSSSFIAHFYFHCLEPVVPVKKQGELGGRQVGRLGESDHSPTSTAPVKGGIFLERGLFIAAGAPSAVKAWQAASRRTSATSIGSKIISKIFGKVWRERRDNCWHVFSRLIHEKGFSLFVLKSHVISHWRNGY